jgi:hypothetical protein
MNRVGVVSGLVLVLGMVALAAMGQSRPKADYKVSKLSLSQVGVSCVSGAEPKADKLGDILIITCPEGGAR